MTVTVVDSGVGDAGFDDDGWGAPAGVSVEECCPVEDAALFARQIPVRLPALGEAMRQGRLEEHKAGIIVSTVADLDDAQARRVVERLLGRAPDF